MKEGINSYSERDVYFEPAMKQNKRGRGRGGIVIFAKKNLESVGYYLNSRIGVIKISNLAIITVYMPFEIKNKSSSANELENEFIECIQLIIMHFNELKSENYDVMLCGDFNCEPDNNQYRYSKYITDLTRKTGLVLIDKQQHNSPNYTFITHMKWIDRVFCDSNLAKNTLVRIVPRKETNSDHFSLVISTEVATRNEHTEKRTKKNNYIPIDILQNSEFRVKLCEAITPEITRLKTKLISAIETDYKTKIHEIINEFHTSMLDIANSVYKSSNRNLNREFKPRNKVWWNECSQRAHERKQALLQIPKRNRTAIMNREIRILKKRIDKIRKTYEKNKKQNVVRKINHEKKENMVKFWRLVKRHMQHKTTVNSSIKVIKEQFEKIFNERICCDHRYEDSCISQLEKLLTENSANPRDDIKVSRMQIDLIIDNLPNGTAVGMSDVSCDLFKAYKSDQFNCFVHLLIQSFYKIGYVPPLLNISLMVPLIKDQTKSSSDPGNIRPISISECLASIFEKVTLHILDNKWPSNPKQFGFKKSASCSHPTVILTEIMRLVK